MLTIPYLVDYHHWLMIIYILVDYIIDVTRYDI
jgi:hypothetical protein